MLYLSRLKYWLLIVNCFLLCLVTVCKGQAMDSVRKDSLKTSPGLRHQTTASYILPVALISYGVLSFHNQAIDKFDINVTNHISQGHGTFINHVDDFMQFAPVAAVYGLNLFNVKGKHNFADRTGRYILAYGLMASTTKLVKHVTNQLRPNGQPYGFPSGHTGTAFVAAEFLSQEYGDISPWYTVAGYTVATSVALLRVYNNYHAFRDVVTGAGVGIASTKIAYLTYPYIKKVLFPGQNQISMVPTYQSGIYGVYIAGRF